MPSINAGKVNIRTMIYVETNRKNPYVEILRKYFVPEIDPQFRRH